MWCVVCGVCSVLDAIPFACSGRDGGVGASVGVRIAQLDYLKGLASRFNAGRTASTYATALITALAFMHVHAPVLYCDLQELQWESVSAPNNLTPLCLSHRATNIEVVAGLPSSWTSALHVFTRTVVAAFCI